MKIALVGYGKMGHMIEAAAVRRGNTIVMTADSFAPDASFKSSDSTLIAQEAVKSGADVIIEFTHPDSVMNNVEALLPTKIPVVVGTTGWMDKLDYVKKLASQCGGTLFYAANFSIGVNLFYKIISQAASLMSDYDEYDTAIWEAHHNQKADSPSGTALDIASYVLKANKLKTEVVTDAFHEKPQPHQLHVSSTRIGSVPGTHTVFFDSSADTIELTHTARSREGFALGAVHAAEWLHSEKVKGVLTSGSSYTMKDMLDL